MGHIKTGLNMTGMNLKHAWNKSESHGAGVLMKSLAG